MNDRGLSVWPTSVAVLGIVEGAGSEVEQAGLEPGTLMRYQCQQTVA